MWNSSSSRGRGGKDGSGGKRGGNRSKSCPPRRENSKQDGSSGNGNGRRDDRESPPRSGDACHEVESTVVTSTVVEEKQGFFKGKRFLKVFRRKSSTVSPTSTSSSSASGAGSGAGRGGGDGDSSHSSNDLSLVYSRMEIEVEGSSRRSDVGSQGEQSVPLPLPLPPTAQREGADSVSKLQEELDTLRQRLDREQAEMQKLRNEVSLLRLAGASSGSLPGSPAHVGARGDNASPVGRTDSHRSDASQLSCLDFSLCSTGMLQYEGELKARITPATHSKQTEKTEQHMDTFLVDSAAAASHVVVVPAVNELAVTMAEDPMVKGSPKTPEVCTEDHPSLVKESVVKLTETVSESKFVEKYCHDQTHSGTDVKLVESMRKTTDIHISSPGGSTEHHTSAVSEDLFEFYVGADHDGQATDGSDPSRSPPKSNSSTDDQDSVSALERKTDSDLDDSPPPRGPKKETHSEKVSPGSIDTDFMDLPDEDPENPKWSRSTGPRSHFSGPIPGSINAASFKNSPRIKSGRFRRDSSNPSTNNTTTAGMCATEEGAQPKPARDPRPMTPTRPSQDGGAVAVSRRSKGWSSRHPSLDLDAEPDEDPQPPPPPPSDGDRRYPEAELEKLLKTVKSFRSENPPSVGHKPEDPQTARISSWAPRPPSLAAAALAQAPRRSLDSQTGAAFEFSDHSKIRDYRSRHALVEPADIAHQPSLISMADRRGGAQGTCSARTSSALREPKWTSRSSTASPRAAESGELDLDEDVRMCLEESRRLLSSSASRPVPPGSEEGRRAVPWSPRRSEQPFSVLALSRRRRSMESQSSAGSNPLQGMVERSQQQENLDLDLDLDLDQDLAMVPNGRQAKDRREEDDSARTRTRSSKVQERAVEEAEEEDPKRDGTGLRTSVTMPSLRTQRSRSRFYVEALGAKRTTSAWPTSSSVSLLS